MRTHIGERFVADHPCDTPDCGQVTTWRFERLVAAGFDRGLAAVLAASRAYDLHALLDLVDRGCPPRLAARIVAPIEDDEDRP